MSGTLRTINSVADIEWSVANLPKDQWGPELQTLIDDNNIKMWSWVKELAEGETGKEDDTHRIEEMREMGPDGTEKVTRIQYEKVWNPLAQVFRMYGAKTPTEYEKVIATINGYLRG